MTLEENRDLFAVWQALQPEETKPGIQTKPGIRVVAVDRDLPAELAPRAWDLAK